MKPHIILIHGINCWNPFYYRSWIKAIPGADRFNIIPVKWKSRSWNTDLMNIFFSKVYRDEQIAKVTQAILSTGTDPVILLSHSFGTVWAYKAWHRLQERIQMHPAKPGSNAIQSPYSVLLGKKVWSVMVGAALGGTHIPFGGVYIDIIKNEYMSEKPPVFIDRLINLYNKDDYVSSQISMQRMENIKIESGGFNPGFQEHDAVHYLKTTQFQKIINEFAEKYSSKDIRA